MNKWDPCITINSLILRWTNIDRFGESNKQTVADYIIFYRANVLNQKQEGLCIIDMNEV